MGFSSSSSSSYGFFCPIVVIGADAVPVYLLLLLLPLCVVGAPALLCFSLSATPAFLCCYCCCVRLHPLPLLSLLPLTCCYCHLAGDCGVPLHPLPAHGVLWWPAHLGLHRALPHVPHDVRAPDPAHQLRPGCSHGPHRTGVTAAAGCRVWSAGCGGQGCGAQGCGGQGLEWGMQP